MHTHPCTHMCTHICTLAHTHIPDLGIVGLALALGTVRLARSAPVASVLSPGVQSWL